ncbi:conserved hypothetical protein [Histoplasma capsulatum var. duboisii H88]|uniref:Methyltransferase n=1 Tax=Ajellomyces capsulatus (strain H88) TaxID=544711 RepID=F0UF78_AJEC8|nr:conserved hypothetical protein [Histoplasma capsulatum var. duboisii H88]QSS54879.1 methyltransferase [Histoplasma capsulatum var. duboisii H88]
MSKQLLPSDSKPQTPLHVFDLPQLYTKPTATDILQALERLAVKPRSFGNSDGNAQLTILQTGISQYLTSIIASALSWIDSDELRESIWDAASARLCERSGRTAMPSISRVFTIPMTQQTNFQLTLHEPSLTSDNLGMKTWVSSYLLAKRLHSFLTVPHSIVPSRSKIDRRLRALELGSGTGLVGLSFAVLWGSAASIRLTDLDSIVPNLAHNVEINQELLRKTGASVSTGVLNWSLETDARPEPDGDKRCDVILAADPLYSPDHPQWLVQTIQRWLYPDAGSRVVVEMPLRDAYLPQVEEFRYRMEEAGLVVLMEGEEIGFDDWEGSDGTALEVRCWWAIWGWRVRHRILPEAQ